MLWHKNTAKNCFVSEKKILPAFKDTVYEKFSEADFLHTDMLCMIKESYFRWTTDPLLTRSAESIGRYVQDEVCLLSIELINQYIEELNNVRQKVIGNLQAQYLGLAKSVEKNLSLLDSRVLKQTPLQDQVRKMLFDYTNKASTERKKYAEEQWQQYNSQLDYTVNQDVYNNLDDGDYEDYGAVPAAQGVVGRSKPREAYRCSYLGSSSARRARYRGDEPGQDQEQQAPLTPEQVDELISKVKLSEPVEERIPRTCKEAILSLQSSPTGEDRFVYGCQGDHTHSWTTDNREELRCTTLMSRLFLT